MAIALDRADYGGSITVNSLPVFLDREPFGGTRKPVIVVERARVRLPSMASILSRLFGGSTDKQAAAKGGKEEAHGGFLIRAQPVSSSGQWRLAGMIVKQDQAGDLEREFQRADTFQSRDEAEAAAIRKGKQIIDEQGAGLFASGEATGRV